MSRDSLVTPRPRSLLVLCGLALGAQALGAPPPDAPPNLRFVPFGNLIDAPEWGGLFESITAYGRYWVFNPSGTMIETNPLTSVSRYASGPCAYRPSGQQCTFDSRELRRLPDGSQIETVTAYGRYFEWWNGTPAAHLMVISMVVPYLRK